MRGASPHNKLFSTRGAIFIRVECSHCLYLTRSFVAKFRRPWFVPRARALFSSELGTVSGCLGRPRTPREHTFAAVRPARPTGPKQWRSHLPYHPCSWFLRVPTLSTDPKQPPAPLRFVGGLPTDLQWTARGQNIAKSRANPRPQRKHPPEPCFGVFVDDYSVAQGEWGACCTRAIDSIHQGLSNALLD